MNLKRILLLIIVASLALFGAWFYKINKPLQSATNTQELSLSRENLLALVNKERIKANLKPLKSSKNLQTTAQMKATDMAVRGYFEHNLPGTKHYISPRMEEIGFKNCTHYGENLAYGFNTSKEIVSGWMNSKTHRDNLLDNEFKTVGFGINGDIVAQHFCNK